MEFHSKNLVVTMCAYMYIVHSWAKTYDILFLYMFKTTSPSSQGPRHQGGTRASHRHAKERWGGGGMDKMLVFLSYSFCYTFKVSEWHMTCTVMRGPLRAT